MKRLLRLPLLAAAVATAGCSDLTIPDYNRPGLGDLRDSPNAATVNAATTGMLDASRLDITDYVRLPGVLGREAYYLDPNEGRYVTELVRGSMDPSSFAGGRLWTNRYASIQQAIVIEKALDKLQPGAMSDAQKSGVRGFAKFVAANDYIALLNTREQIAIDVDRDITEEPAPFVDRPTAYAHVLKLLDESDAELAKAGASFSFSLPSGFTQFGFNTPAQMRKVNRALRARVNLYLGNYTQVLTDLTGSFLATTGAVSPTSRDLLHQGVYYNFSTASGDLVNGNTNPAPQRADTMLRKDAQKRVTRPTPADSFDVRFTQKISVDATERCNNGVCSFLRFQLYNTRPFYGAGGQNSPVPIIRNEELILMRAEARWKTGNLPGAIEDLNFVRVNSGGLAARTDLTTANFQDALLYERRYSLLYEGGHRWIDLRRFNLLNTVTNYPRTGDVSPAYFPVPFNECLARPAGTPGCGGAK